MAKTTEANIFQRKTECVYNHSPFKQLDIKACDNMINTSCRQVQKKGRDAFLPHFSFIIIGSSLTLLQSLIYFLCACILHISKSEAIVVSQMFLTTRVLFVSAVK